MGEKFLSLIAFGIFKMLNLQIEELDNNLKKEASS
jgi:hypothetical protein